MDGQTNLLRGLSFAFSHPCLIRVHPWPFSPMSLRYVILEHTHQGVHFDLMLEVDGKLRTWRLATPPEAGRAIAEASFDHRLLYLDYEGPISGDRGHVRQWDAGTYTGDASGEALVSVELTGRLLHGTLAIRRSSQSTWEVTFTPHAARSSRTGPTGP
jgi:DNA polymerase ligase (LigD)-like protein